MPQVSPPNEKVKRRVRGRSLEWSADEVSLLLQRHDAGVPTALIRPEIGRSLYAVQRKLWELGRRERNLPPRITQPVRKCLMAVCRHYECEPGQLLNRSRHRPWVHRRMLVFWLAAKVGAGIAKTGRRVGGFDHTTVLHGCRWVERRRASDSEYRELTDRLLADLLAETPPPPPLSPPPPKASEPDLLLQVQENTFYDGAPNMACTQRTFLIKQNERFLAALEASGERP